MKSKLYSLIFAFALFSVSTANALDIYVEHHADAYNIIRNDTLELVSHLGLLQEFAPTFLSPAEHNNVINMAHLLFAHGHVTTPSAICAKTLFEALFVISHNFGASRIETSTGNTILVIKTRDTAISFKLFPVPGGHRITVNIVGI